MCGGSLVAKSCPTLCNPMDCRPLGPSVHGILRQEYWSGLPFPSPGDLPDPGIKSGSSALQADSLPSELPGKPTQRDGLGREEGGGFRMGNTFIPVVDSF